MFQLCHIFFFAKFITNEVGNGKKCFLPKFPKRAKCYCRHRQFWLKGAVAPVAIVWIRQCFDSAASAASNGFIPYGINLETSDPCEPASLSTDGNSQRSHFSSVKLTPASVCLYCANGSKYDAYDSPTDADPFRPIYSDGSVCRNGVANGVSGNEGVARRIQLRCMLGIG